MYYIYSTLSDYYLGFSNNSDSYLFVKESLKSNQMIELFLNMKQSLELLPNELFSIAVLLEEKLKKLLVIFKNQPKDSKIEFFDSIIPASEEILIFNEKIKLFTRNKNDKEIFVLSKFLFLCKDCILKNDILLLKYQEFGEPEIISLKRKK